MFQSKYRLARIPKVYIKMMDGFYKFGIQRELKDLKSLWDIKYLNGLFALNISFSKQKRQRILMMNQITFKSEILRMEAGLW